MKRTAISILIVSAQILADAAPYTNNVDGRIYDSSSGRYANSSWVYNNDMGWMGCTNNGTADFSHSTFNNVCNYTSLANGLPYEVPSTVILSHSSGYIWIDLPGNRVINASHATLPHSNFSGSGATADFSYANIANSTVNIPGIYHYTDVDNATITAYPISSRGVTGVPASLPPGVSLRNGIFFSEDNFEPSDHPNADFSFEAFNGTKLLGDYSGADFSGATFGSEGMEMAELGGTFSNANFSQAIFNGVLIDPDDVANFYGANFSGAIFSEDMHGGWTPYFPSIFSNLVAGLVSNNCTLSHAEIPGFPDGYNGDPVYDFTFQASNFNAQVIALEDLVVAFSNQAAAESSGLSIIVADLDADVNDLASTAAGQSNWISTTVVNWNSILEDVADDVTGLDSQVSSLSNTVTETINDLNPGIDVIPNTNGFIVLRMGVKQSGDLETWDTLYDIGDISIPATNNVQFYRIDMTKGTKGGP